MMGGQNWERERALSTSMIYRLLPHDTHTCIKGRGGKSRGPLGKKSMMAGRRQHAYRLFSPGMEGGPGPGPGPTGLDSDEFEESDVWGYEAESKAAEFRKPIPAARASARKKGDRGATTAAGSLPVNIPDWSKILREEYGGKSYRSRVLEEEEEEEEDGTGAVIPPHELLWKSRAASLSVQEGIGRTLKGRDLSRVRNAIWEKTGFQD